MEETGKKLTLEEILEEVEGTELPDAVEEENQTDGQGVTSESPPGGVGSLVGLMTSHPELLQELPEILGAVRNLTGLLGNAGNGNAVSGRKPSRPAITSPVPLLTALRPYLSENRRRAVDAILNVSKLSESFRSMR